VKKFSFTLLSVALGGALLSSCGGGGGIAEPDVHYRDFGVNVAVRSAPYLTPEKHGSNWGKGDCLLCHQNFKHTMATPDFPTESYQSLIDRAVESVGRSRAIMVCSACHGTNGVEEVNGEKVERKCLVCHDSIDKLHFYKGASQRKESFHDFDSDGKLSDKDCLVCHWQPDMDGIVEPSTDLASLQGYPPRSLNELCLACHSPTGAKLFDSEVADTNGDGSPDEKLTPPKAPPDISTPWSSTDWHGSNSFTSSASFKDVSLGGELLFHTNHEPLLCSQCHNPHSSSNSALIIERVGESLTAEMLVKQTDNTTEAKYAVVDPQTTQFFKELSYWGVVNGKDRTYDLSKPEELKAFSSLPVKNLDSESVQVARELTSSLCAACHSGAYYSPVNGLSLPVDVKSHGDANSKCTECHIHGGTF